MVGPTSTHHLKPSSTTTIKFLCSYGGKILPRYPDGKLRYQGGETRVLAVDRSISFPELLVKLGELCGTSVSLRCQLPSEDLDALVSITCNEDLINLIEEYDRAASPPSSLKIRAFLSLPKKISPTPSSASSSSTSTTTFEAASPKSPPSSTYSAAVSGGSYTSTSRFGVAATNRCVYPTPKPVKFPICYERSTGKLPYYAHGNTSRTFLIHNGNHWQ